MLWIRVCINSTLSKLIAIHDYTTGLVQSNSHFPGPHFLSSHCASTLKERPFGCSSVRKITTRHIYPDSMYGSTQIMHHSITIPLLLQSLDIISVAVKCLPLTVITVDYLFILPILQTKIALRFLSPRAFSTQSWVKVLSVWVSQNFWSIILVVS